MNNHPLPKPSQSEIEAIKKLIADSIERFPYNRATPEMVEQLTSMVQRAKIEYGIDLETLMFEMRGISAQQLKYNKLQNPTNLWKELPVKDFEILTKPNK